MFKFISELKGKSILITGGSGFFGKVLCYYLIEIKKKYQIDFEIIALARTPYKIDGVRFLSHDVTQPLILDEKIHYIIHAANPATENLDAQEMLSIMINGTQSMLRFADKNGCEKFLLVSSGAVYGEQPANCENISEEDHFGYPLYDSGSAYTSGKRISEIMALEWSHHSKANLSIARCFAFSGEHLPLDRHFAIGNFIKDVVDKRKIELKSDGSAIRSYMDEEDLAHWLVTILIQSETRGIYNVGSDQSLSILDLANRVAKLSGCENVTSLQSQGATRRNKYVPSIEKAKHDFQLGLSVSLDQSIQKMLEKAKEIK